jgi:Ca-activated chloride channel family protein
MNFAQPYWLVAGLAACLFLLWRYRAFNRQQRAALARFVSPRLFEKLTATVSAQRRRLKQGVFIAGIACLFVALARPQVGFRWQEVHRKGIELLVAVDTSKSMLTEDVKPDRLDRAKLAVNDLVNKLNGDSVGLMAFAGEAFLQCPFTVDYDAFRESLDSIDTTTIPRGGTDIGGAIREARAVLNTRADKDKILVLITDGEDLGGDSVAAAQAAAKDGVKIFTVGVGSAAGELIPVPGANGGTDFVKDADGQFVKSRLDETTLKQIAAATGGMYAPLGQEGQGLTAIYDQGLAPFTRHDLASRRTKVYIERFQWPLLAGLLCFASELLIGTRKRTVRSVSTRSAKPFIATDAPAGNWSPARTAATVALALFVLPAASHASPASAEKAYDKGQYSLAEQEYAATPAKEAKQPKLEFNLGSAAYKSGNYAQAATAFQNTLHTTEVPVQQNAYYNLGNTQYRVGQAVEKASPQDTIKTWEQAVQSYDAALQIKPDDTDAKFNRDLVQKKLEQLKKEQQQQQKQQQQNQQNKNQQQSQNKQSQQSSGQSQNQNQSKPDQNNQGQGQQAQNKSGQEDQNPAQQQNQQAQQNQRPANSGSQGNEKQPSQPGQQSAQAGQPQSLKPNEQKAGANAGQPENQQAQTAQAAPDQPGKLTKEEANQLLDSLKGDQHALPAAQLARGPAKPQDNQPPLKDW